MTGARSLATDAGALPASAAAELNERGFTLLPGPARGDELQALIAAYDAVMAGAVDEVRVGSTSARLTGLNRRGLAFKTIPAYAPLPSAAALVIGEPFRLSSLLARTLLPRRPAQPLHVDCAADARGWPLLSFILTIDDFTADNGATRFLPGSHRNPGVEAEEVQACGPAGTLIVYNGSVLHEHGANTTDRPRRSIQGAFIRSAWRAPE